MERKFLLAGASLACIVLAALVYEYLFDNAGEEAREAIKSSETVAAARRTAWPSPGKEKIDQFDPVRTRDNLMVALDMSGSMGGGECSGEYRTKSAAAKDVLRVWLDSVPAAANVGLAAFVGGKSRVYVPLGTNNRERFRAAVERFVPKGGTPLSAVVDLAERELERQARYQQGYGSYRILVITDGEHSSGYDPRPVVNRILGNPANPVEIHTVGFCIDDDHALNQPGLTHYRSAKNPRELRAGLESVLAESQTFDAADFEVLKREGQSAN